MEKGTLHKVAAGYFYINAAMQAAFNVGILLGTAAIQ